MALEQHCTPTGARVDLCGAMRRQWERTARKEKLAENYSQLKMSKSEHGFSRQELVCSLSLQRLDSVGSIRCSYCIMHRFE
jgi:hypothetical protein